MLTRIAAALLLTQLAACGTQTTLRLRSGQEVKAKIAGRIDNTLYLRTDYGKRTLDICEVEDVSHPGKAVAITGTALLGAGAIIAMATLPGWENRRSHGATIAGSVYSVAFIATGGSLAGWGYSHWNSSEEKTGELPAAECGHWEEGDGYDPYEPHAPYAPPSTGQPQAAEPHQAPHQAPPADYAPPPTDQAPLRVPPPTLPALPAPTAPPVAPPTDEAPPAEQAPAEKTPADETPPTAPPTDAPPPTPTPL